MKSKYTIIFYFIFFVILYFFTLNFNYVEGDDAATILYHLCGRNPQIQLPYASYNSGLDFLLQISSLKSETSLREFAIFISFISGFFILTLCAIFLNVFFEGQQGIDFDKKNYLYIALPFIIPDIIFHSLIINSSNISFVFLLSSLILFVKFLRTNLNKFLYFSTILFAIAIPFRWTMLVSLPIYTGLALYFYPIQNYSKQTYKLFVKILLSNFIGILLAIIFIYITGYNIQNIYETILNTTKFIDNMDSSFMSIFSVGSAFFTPALCLLIIFGFLKIHELHKSQPKLIISIISCIFLSILPFLVIGFGSSFKFLITLLPILLIIVMFGFNYALKNIYYKTALAICAILPWFLGIQVNSNDTFCGPGFELNTFKNVNLNSKINDNHNPDKRVKINNIKIKLSAGLYMPMPEGPRPLYGYFYVFFKNGWKNQINLFTNERKSIYKLLVSDDKIIYIQDRKTAYFQCDLFKNNFFTKTNFYVSSGIQTRDFTSKNTKIKVNVIPENCSKNDWIINLLKTSKESIIFNSSYSSDILRLIANKDINIEIIGPFTIIKKGINDNFIRDKIF